MNKKKWGGGTERKDQTKVTPKLCKVNTKSFWVWHLGLIMEPSLFQRTSLARPLHPCCLQQTWPVSDFSTHHSIYAAFFHGPPIVLTLYLHYNLGIIFTASDSPQRPISSSAALPPKGCSAFPNSTTGWEPSVQTHKSLEILYSNHSRGIK